MFCLCCHPHPTPVLPDSHWRGYVLQSPHWSLATFGFQQRRPPPAPGSSGDRKGTAQFAVQCEPGWSPAQPAPQHAAAQPWFPHVRCATSKQWRVGLVAAALLALLVWGCVHLSARRHIASGSSGDHRQQPQQQQCRLSVRGSVWDQHCQRLERVCVDQGMLILHDSRYQQRGGRKAGKLPELLVDTSKVTVRVLAGWWQV